MDKNGCEVFDFQIFSNYCIFAASLIDLWRKLKKLLLKFPGLSLA